MSCVRVGDAIICGTNYPRGRLHVGNRYIWVEIHPYCGPAFWLDAAETKDYFPEDENDPLWTVFADWLKRKELK